MENGESTVETVLNDIVETPSNEDISYSEPDSEVEQEYEEGSESVEGLQEEVAEAIQDGATQEDIQEMIETFQLKVNGKEIEKTLDWNDKDSIKRELQLAAAGRGAMQETAELKKLYGESLQDFRDDPRKAMEELGINPMEWAEQMIRGHLEEEAKPEEIKREEKYARDLADARAEVEKLKKANLDKENQENIDREFTSLMKEVDDAFDDPSVRIPRNPDTINRIANMLEWAENEFEEKYDPSTGQLVRIPSYPDVSVRDIMPLVQNEYQSEISNLVETMPVEFMEEFFGKKMFERHRESRIAKHAPKKPNLSGGGKAPKKEKKDPGNYSDFFRDLDKKYGI